MNIKNSIGLVASRIFDWKTNVNPITQRFYPKLYSRFSIQNWLPSFGKKTTQIHYSSPIPSLMIDRLMNYSHLYFYDFPSLYPYNELKMVDNWIHQLKRMANYFSGFGYIETQDAELNQLAFTMRDKVQAYRKKRFDIDKTDNDDDFDIDRSKEKMNNRLDIEILKKTNKTIAMNKILRLLIDADSQLPIYGDTDSIILPEITETEVLDLIRNLSDPKSMIIVTGRRGSGKTSLAIRLSEVLKQDTPLIFDYAILKECTIFPHENKDIAVFPSITMCSPYAFHRVGLLFNVWYLDREKKEMKAKFYVFGGDKRYIEILKAYNTTIPYCSLENYKKYQKSIIESLQR